MANIVLNEEELILCESFHTPQCLLECLFHDFDNLAEFDKEQFGELRLYQFPLISDEAIIDFDTTAEYHGLSKKQKFQLMKNVGDAYVMGARKFGKSLCVEILDLGLRMLQGITKKIAFSSVDLIHVREILDKIKTCFQNHPICKNWERRITGAPDYKFELKNNTTVNSVNFNIGSKNPGRQWYGKHVNVVYIEEASMETEEVYNKRKDALSEFGAIFRVSGMTDFTPHSPAGKAFYSPSNRKKVLNLPQYVNPMWDEAEKQDRLEFYGGEDSIGYRVFVKGEVVEDGCSVFDMQRLSKMCYKFDRRGNHIEQVKRFEVPKERYGHFRNMVVVERPENAERIFINTDVGEKHSEIIIHSENGDKYKYLYNIVLYNLTDEEQYEILMFLAQKLKANVIGVDCGDGMGRAIYRRLEKVIPKDNLVWYDGSSKLDVDFEYNEAGDIITENGKPVMHQEYMSEWSVKRLQDIFYGGRCYIPEDYKFETQFSVVMSMITGQRTRYKCVSQSGDHLFDAWRVFAIAQFLKKDFNLTKPVKMEWGTGVSSWKPKRS